MASNTTLLDGNYAAPVEIGAPRWYFPFRELLDNASCYFEQDYWQTETTYAPVQLGTEHPTLRGMYLVIESDRKSLIAGILQFTRTYATIPKNQVTYTTRSITKPTIANQQTPIVAIRSPDNTLVDISTAVKNSTGFWDTLNNVWAPFFVTGLDLFDRSPTASGGTFTLTYKASTTAALAYSASDATINAALNGLASVISDGLTYSASNNLATSALGYLGLFITSGSTTTRVTMDTTSLTVSTPPAKKTLAWFVNVSTQYIQLGIPVTATAHGYAVDNPIIVVTNYTGFDANSVGALQFPVGRWDVYDANTLVVSNYLNITGAITSYVAKKLRTYTPGAVVLSCRDTIKFYLPGITAGITTPADIPITSPNIADADIIAAVLGNGTFTPVAFSGPSQWMSSAIWMTTVSELNFALL